MSLFTEILEKLDDVLVEVRRPLFWYETLFVRFSQHAWYIYEVDVPLPTFGCSRCGTVLELTGQLSYTITYGTSGTVACENGPRGSTESAGKKTKKGKGSVK